MREVKMGLGGSRCYGEGGGGGDQGGGGSGELL